MDDRQLTPHFKLSEFFIHDQATTNAEYLRNIEKLAQRLEELRETFGKAIHISSGFRTPAHNKAVGGEPNSFHLRGLAADIQVSGMTPKQVYTALDKTWIGGLGLYPLHCHVDIRPYRARWKKV